MNKKSYLALVLAVAAGAALLLPSRGESSGKQDLGLRAIRVESPKAVRTGPAGAYFITADRTVFHLRCPCGKCTKHAALPLEAGGGPWVWNLSGDENHPSLSPSIHWFEPDGSTTHWHGWLQEGFFSE